MLKRIVSLLVLLSLETGMISVLKGCASSAQNGESMTSRDSTPRHVTILDDDLSPLRSAFNNTSDQWRVVALVSPTCSECVFGAEAVQKEITDPFLATQVSALIVWIPMIDTDSEKAARASATIFAPERAAQFYDAQQGVGWGYARQTFAGFPDRARNALPEGHWLAQMFDEHCGTEQPQWDLYMLYAPGVRWEDSNAPPMPTHWIRHFGRRDDRKTSTYWQDTPESGPRDGDLFEAIRVMADEAIGKPQAMESAMRIEVLGFPGCPNTPQTMTNVEKAVDASGITSNVVYVDQMKLPETDSRRGWPSPTVLVNGRDLFGMAGPKGPAMECRIYKGGAPSEAEVAAALKATQVALAASKEPRMVCTLTPEQLSAQREGLLPGLLKRADERTPLERGYRLRFTPHAGLLDEIAGVVERERGCCQFLKFQITVESNNGPIFLEVTGPAGTRGMLDAL